MVTEPIIKIIDARTSGLEQLRIAVANRAAEGLIGQKESLQTILASVRSIVQGVKEGGDAAVVRFTRAFDGVSLSPYQFCVDSAEVRQAYDKVTDAVKESLAVAKRNIREFHEKNLRQSWQEVTEDGSVFGQNLAPIERVGVYIPGGKGCYPSSVLMSIIPAKIAGCKEIVMVSPPSYEGGTIHPLTLLASDMAGATKVFKVGGAQAIAALAFGTESIPKVDKIVGPGNIYVTLAKREVFGEVDIDKEAGPSEILIIADESAHPALVAADMLSQAEHDEMASVALLTTSSEVAELTQVEVESQLEAMDKKEIARQALMNNSFIAIVPTLQDAVELSNLHSPEHLELMVSEPFELFKLVTNAGAVYLGHNSPVSVGDYVAGPNHVLPTGGRARFASPLTVEDFRKVTNLVCLSRQRFETVAPHAIQLANAEGFTGHASAVRARIQG